MAAPSPKNSYQSTCQQGKMKSLRRYLFTIVFLIISVKLPNFNAEAKQADLYSTIEKPIDVTNQIKKQNSRKGDEVENRVHKPKKGFAKFWESLLSPLSGKVQSLENEIRNKEKLVEDLNASIVKLDQSVANQSEQIKSLQSEKTKATKRVVEFERIMSELQQSNSEILQVNGSNKKELEILSNKNAQAEVASAKLVESLNAVQKKLDQNITGSIEQLRNNSEVADQNLSIVINEQNQKVLTLENTVKENAQKFDIETQNIDQKINDKIDWLSWVLGAFGLVFIVRFIISRNELKKNREGINQMAQEVEAMKGDIDQNLLKQGKSTGEFLALLNAVQPQDTNSSSEPTTSLDTDHSLPLSVYTEIERMEARLIKLDDSDKNKKPMSKALERLEKKLTGMQYERIQYLGKPYKEGMVCEARFIPSNDPVHKVPTITRVIKPYISYCGEKIQTAEIEVSECG